MKKSPEEKLVSKWCKKRYWPWFNWKIYHKYLNWRMRKNSRKIAEHLAAYAKSISFTNANIAEIQPLPTPESPIFFLKKAEDE